MLFLVRLQHLINYLTATINTKKTKKIK